MSYQASGEASMIPGALIGAAIGIPIIAAVGALALAAGTCLLVGKGICFGVRKTKKAIDAEIQRREELERKRRQQISKTVQQIQNTLENLSKISGVNGHELETTLNEASVQTDKIIEISFQKEQLLEKRLNLIINHYENNKSANLSNVSTPVQSPDLWIEQVKATLNKTRKENDQLKAYKTIVLELKERLKNVSSGQKKIELPTFPELKIQGGHFQEVSDKKERLGVIYETLISDTFIGAYVLADQKGKDFQQQLVDIEKYINASDYINAEKLIDLANKSAADIQEEFSSKYASIWGDHVAGSAKSALNDLGYKADLELTKHNHEYSVSGFNGIRHFEFKYNDNNGSFRFDLGHHDLENQSACDKEVEKFIGKMKEKGIALSIDNHLKKHPKRQHQTDMDRSEEVDVVTQIIRAVESAGWDCQATEEEEFVTVTIRQGYFEKQEKLDKTRGLEQIHSIINAMKQQMGAYELKRQKE